MAEVIAVCGRYSLTPADSEEIKKIIRQVQDRVPPELVYEEA